MRFVLLLVAAVVAVVAGVVALQWSSKNNAQPASAPVAQAPVTESSNVNTIDVLVAKEPIPMGTVIKEGMIDKQPWPENLVLEGFIVSGSKDADIVGKVTRTNFLAREPFMNSKLGNPNDPSFLAANLRHNMRAVTLATDAVTGVAGYVFPGDRVDILLTHNVPEEINESKKPGLTHMDKPAYTEVLVPNAKVLAVNTREVKESNNIVPASVTVEVSGSYAEKIRLGEKSGTLSLTLRALRDQYDNYEPDPATLSNLTRIHVTEASSPEGVRIIRGVGHDSEAAGSQGVPSAGNTFEPAPAATPEGTGASQ